MPSKLGDKKIFNYILFYAKNLFTSCNNLVYSSLAMYEKINRGYSLTKQRKKS